MHDFEKYLEHNDLDWILLLHPFWTYQEDTRNYWIPQSAWWKKKSLIRLVSPHRWSPITRGHQQTRLNIGFVMLIQTN